MRKYKSTDTVTITELRRMLRERLAAVPEPKPSDRISWPAFYFGNRARQNELKLLLRRFGGCP